MSAPRAGGPSRRRSFAPAQKPQYVTEYETACETGQAYVELTGAGVATRVAAASTGVPRATAIRRTRPAPPVGQSPRPAPANRLSLVERARVLEVLDSAEFVDQPPLQVYATLLARGQYLCSVSTMNRVPDESFADATRRAEVVVVGGSSRHGIHRPTAAGVVRHAWRPVAVVPLDELSPRTPGAVPARCPTLRT